MWSWWEINIRYLFSIMQMVRYRNIHGGKFCGRYDEWHRPFSKRSDISEELGSSLCFEWLFENGSIVFEKQLGSYLFFTIPLNASTEIVFPSRILFGRYNKNLPHGDFLGNLVQASLLQECLLMRIPSGIRYARFLKFCYFHFIKPSLITEA